VRKGYRVVGIIGPKKRSGIENRLSINRKSGWEMYVQEIKRHQFVKWTGSRGTVQTFKGGEKRKQVQQKESGRREAKGGDIN